MTGLPDSRAILGIDPTPRGLAFAFFEGGEVRDWGTRSCRNGLAALDRILTLCPAEVVVMEDATAEDSQRRPRPKRLLRDLERSATRRRVEVVKVARQAVRQAWIAEGRSTKHAVAVAIAERFPVLEMVLPRPRKVYRSEEARTEIFDAASLVLHVFASRPH